MVAHITLDDVVLVQIKAWVQFENLSVENNF